MTRTETIDLQDLLEKAKPLSINLIAEEWIEADERRFPATNEGSAAADAYLMAKHNVTKDYEVIHMKRWKQTGRPMYDIVRDLNDRMKQLGIEPQEGGFSYQFYAWQTPQEQRAASVAGMTGRPFSQDEWEAQHKRDYSRPLPLDHRWLSVYPVSGGSEGYYLHVDCIYQQRDSQQLKTLRGLMSRIEHLPYDEHTYHSDKELIDKAKTAFYGEPCSWRKMFALAKTWQWDNACACCAVAATLLGA